MKYWLISDTHFNHEKLTEWGGRTGDWQEQLWDGLREIPDGDTLIHLGDICIGDDAEVHFKLRDITRFYKDEQKKVKTILVRGNHDGKGIVWYEDHGWDFVCDSFEILYQGHYVYFSHRPQPKMGHFTQNIHGHTHGNMHRSEEYVSYYDDSYHIDISPELMGFKPVNLETLIRKHYKKQILSDSK